MNYIGVYNFIKDIVSNISDVDLFFHGRVSTRTITPVKANENVVVWLFPLESSGGLTENTYQVNETYTANIVFFKKDKLDSAIDQNNINTIAPEMEILKDTNELADRFLRAFNTNNFSKNLSQAADSIEITSFSKGNEIKSQPHLWTGTILTLNFIVMESFNYCQNE